MERHEKRPEKFEAESSFYSCPRDERGTEENS
jgi:hypothetical protein